MIPNCGPVISGSKGEVLLYRLLKEQLDDEFTVIHSLPWLASAARELDGAKAATGEIDFLIVHADLGVLAIEVKGGAHRIQGAAFVHIKSGLKTHAVHQLRSNVHGLARWLGVDPKLRWRIGYSLVFPHSDFKSKVASPALADTTVDPSVSLLMDMSSVSEFGSQIVRIMEYWRSALRNPPLGIKRKTVLINALCPEFDGTPSWATKISWDGKFWLRLTEDQTEIVDNVLVGGNQVITGWPGTGKTLILIEAARRLLTEGKSVLVLTFNSLLSANLREQIGSNQRLRISTWHAFCRTYTQSDKNELEEKWLSQGCLDDIRTAANEGRLPRFDVVLVDEAQAFHPEWMQWLCSWHGANQILASCDETQVFEFEGRRIRLRELCQLMEVEDAFLLTNAIRSPRAVLERLKAAMKPTYQLQSPRELDEAAVNEQLVAEERDGVDDAITQILAGGVAPEDIVVLSKFGWLKAPHARVRFFSLSRFRGMESPVVIISGAEEMDDVELFCAYSRATTLCVALYSAERLGAGSINGKFHQLVLARPGFSEEAKRAHLNAHPGEIIRANLDVVWLGLRSVQLGWLPDWNCWLIEESGPLSRYWIDYLISDFPWAVCYWPESALYQVRVAPRVINVTEESAYGAPHDLYICEACCMLTPHQRDPISDDMLCARCFGLLKNGLDFPNDVTTDRLKHLDAMLSETAPTALSEEQRKNLPLSLAAGAAMEQSVRERGPECRGLGMLGGRISYHAALGLMYSLVNLLPAGRRIVIRKMADLLYGRYLVPSGLTLVEWRKEISTATAIINKRGCLNKVAKGEYEVRDWSLKPPHLVDMSQPKLSEEEGI
ncbi:MULTISPECIES: NERD domain-containing protein/DEAD/DEAH box helicase [unclassified Lysobacter]|uniref:nuclease-related domain-containing DEAD/DEAH box helicase n=1 Tax=unclassified Lysobacter TaxID=2635362 RepID=UPI002035695B|nr:MULTISPECIES: NERD domain-containing protein/DEAD/DEAH box helicase [unclassified Lysobacter]